MRRQLLCCSWKYWLIWVLEQKFFLGNVTILYKVKALQTRSTPPLALSSLFLLRKILFKVLFEKHSSQSITLVALKSSWCSSKVYVHGEEVQPSGSSLCKAKMNLFWWDQFGNNKEYDNLKKPINWLQKRSSI